MDVWLTIWITCLVMATKAVPCHYTHHCSDCDGETGDCLTDCNTGYYDRQCKSNCGKNCRNNTCVLSEYGSGNCTEGCVPGYSGLGCNIPCDIPGDNCTASCPGGCDGGYCQLGSSCVSGCVDSYYGTGCRDCSSSTLGLSVGLSGGFLIMFVVLCCKYCQHLKQNSVTNTAKMCNNVAEVDDATVQELEWYAEIPDTDVAMATEPRSPGGIGEAGGEVAAVANDVVKPSSVSLSAPFDIDPDISLSTPCDTVSDVYLTTFSDIDSEVSLSTPCDVECDVSLSTP
ncbi:uncharacterized protein [Haliotis asinina]|uniref:uncharacterized protein n=1 Tax=Haliotis asinina TaxID=109174 RepID=UPI003531E1FC